MKRTSNTSHRTAIVALFAAAALAACGGGDQALVDSAKAYLEKKDGKAAVIQLKSALQKSPNNAEARYLLGKALLESGDPVAAAVELRKARDLKFADAKVVPPLVKAMLATGESKKVIEQFVDLKLDDADAQAELKTSLAAALAVQGERDKADAALKQALQAKPGHLPALVLNARLKAAAMDVEGALFLLDDVLAKDPAFESALLLKGELLASGKNDVDGALAVWRKAVEAHPNSPPAQVAILNVLLARKDLEGAKRQFEALQKVAPNHLDTKYFEAELAYHAQDYKKAREITDQLLKVAPENARTLQLAGAAEFRQRSMIQAEGFLVRALKAQPGLLFARQLLAQTYLRTGQPKKALEVLEPIAESKAIDAATLNLIGEAHLQAGDLKASEQAYAQAAKLSPENTRARTALAMQKIAKGETERGLDELETIAAGDKGPRADLALVAAHLRKSDLDGALKAIDGLQKKLPDRPIAPHLRGRVLLLKKDQAGAVAAFQKALATDPTYFPSVSSLAALDIAAGKPDAAKQRFDDVLKRDPKNVQAKLALADLKGRSGGSATEVAQMLTDVVKQHPTEPTPRIVLIEHQLTTGNPKAALTAAQEAAAALPNDLRLMDALGRAQLIAGERESASASFKRLASLQPDNPQPLLRLADVHVAQKQFDEARRALKRAIELKPQLLPAQRGLVVVSLLDGKAQEALAVAKTVQKERPNEPIGYLLEADVERERKGWDAAIAAYRTALSKGKATEIASKLHGTLVLADRKGEAERFAAGWEKERPTDAAFQFYLGDHALAQRDLAGAENRYRAVLKLQPNNALALNNVAWLMARQNKPGAVEFATKANQLMPNRAPLLDTLATALAAENQLPKALEAQKRALDLAPEDPSLRLNLARLYIKAGDKVQAKSELEKLSKLGDKFPAQQEVAELLKSV